MVVSEKCHNNNNHNNDNLDGPLTSRRTDRRKNKIGQKNLSVREFPWLAGIFHLR